MQSLTWFPFSIAATILLGISMALYKLPAAKNQSRYAVNFWQLFVALILSVVFFYKSLPAASYGAALFGSLSGIAFMAQSLLQMKALKDLDTNMLFPVTTTSSLVLSILFGMLLFQDRIHLLQMLGIALVILVVYLFSYKGRRLQYSKEIVVLGLGIVLMSSLSKIIQKRAVDISDIHVFQIFQYLTPAIFSLIIYFFTHKKEFAKHLFSIKTIGSGILIGVPGFLGGYMILQALSKGPFSLVYSIHSLYIIIVAIVAYFAFKEKLTWRKTILIALAVLATLLIRIG